ncbi:hypothetical protein H0H92_001687, partial [Tricholoma furcatifolium]
FAFGLALRFALHKHPDSLNLYIVQDMFVVLSPCAFIAADYVLLGRLAAHLDLTKHLIVPANKITKAFVLSDVTTFLIQAAGGGLSASANSEKVDLMGSHLFLAGLVLQLLSFATFTVMYTIFRYRVWKHNPEVYTRDASKPWYNDWRTLANVLSLSCVGILVRRAFDTQTSVITLTLSSQIRSFYRVIELSQGYQGHLATTEAYFYGLDTLPLFIAISIYTPFWPGRFIPPQPQASTESEKIELESPNLSSNGSTVAV